MENGITIDDLRKLCKDDKLKWTLHILKRIRERQIHSTEIIQCINLGEIIEEYPLDKPLPSCLIHGIIGKKHIHVVLSFDEDFIYLITAYCPNNNDWEDDFITRKGK